MDNFEHTVSEVNLLLYDESEHLSSTYSTEGWESFFTAVEDHLGELPYLDFLRRETQ
ncbi:hypothetical protein LJC56_09265 [Christensenellaceae bacterium OttesenSCG-928-K19]|nr:hypothetical protein [Christensenellaceae bacterium OttesenSCG-928-K19]